MNLPLKERARNWLPLLPLLLLLAATYWLNQQVRPLATVPDSKLRHDPDYTVGSFTATTLSEQGRPRFVLHAKDMTHYPDDDSTLLGQPHLLSLMPGAPNVRVTADTGTVASQGDEIFLHRNVRIVRAAFGEQSERVLTTDYLHFLPERDFADTDHPVVMTDALNTIHAVGMEMDNKARTLKLLGQVNSQHERTR
ncbi:MAG: LPS export ABC transporter periplasmic protein LptC [Pseudomonadota bacterium]|jgi:lipopolysaccharide export system protein LptC